MLRGVVALAMTVKQAGDAEYLKEKVTKLFLFPRDRYGLASTLTDTWMHTNT